MATFQEIIKIIITVLLTTLMTIVIMAGTVMKSKADKEYVDREDENLKKEIHQVKKDNETDIEILKNDFLRVLGEIKGSQKITESDIKKILEKI